MTITEQRPPTVTNANATTHHTDYDPQRELLLSLRQGMIMLSKDVTPAQYRAWRLMIAAIEKFTGVEGK